MLNCLEVKKCKDITNNLLKLSHGFNERTFEFFIRISLGISRCFHEEFSERKSMGISNTFSATSDIKTLLGYLKDLAESLSEDLKNEGILGSTVTLTVKTHKF